jgi:O-methyltransferase
MTSPSDGPPARESLARIEQQVAAQAEAQGRANGEQLAALESLGARVNALEREVSEFGARWDADLRDVRTSLDEAGASVSHAIDSVGGLLKRLGRTNKKSLVGVSTLSERVKRVLARLARVSSTFDPSVDPRFVEVAQPLVATRRTMLGYDRLFTLWQAATNVAHLDLPAAEIGTFKGGSAALLSQGLRLAAGAERDVHVVDTFEGHLDSTFSPHDPDEQRGKFRGATYDDVRDYLEAFPGVHVYQGDASAVVASWPERRYGLVHVDVDLYQPTLACLEYFGPRLAEGGILILDDYEAPTCPGVSVATHEYLARNPGFQTWRCQPEQIVLIKR